MGKYKDFDKFFQEMEREPIKMKLFGEVVELPPSIPAKTVLKLMKLYREHGDETNIPESELFDMAFSIFSEEKVNEWCEKGLDLEQLEHIIEWVWSIYGDSTKKKKEKKE